MAKLSNLPKEPERGTGLLCVYQLLSADLLLRVLLFGAAGMDH